MTREEMKAASEHYTQQQTGKLCTWEECEQCWMYRSDLPCHHRELMLAWADGCYAAIDKSEKKKRKEKRTTNNTN